MKVLFKHELKNHFWEMMILCSVNVTIWILFGVYARAFFGDGFLSTLILVSFIMSIVAISVGISVVLIISVIKSFNTKLFSNEGYLTFVLPVSLDKLLIVKYLVNLLWVVIVGLSYIIGVLLMALIIFSGEVNEVFEVIVEIARNIIEHPAMIFLYSLNILSAILLTFSILFFVLAVLNCGKIKKAKFILGLAIFTGINRVISTVRLILSCFSFSFIINEAGKLDLKFVNYFEDGSIFYSLFGFIGDESEVLNISSFIITVASAIVLYLLARLIINRKLELE